MRPQIIEFWVLVGCFIFSPKFSTSPPEPEVLTSQKNWIVSVEFFKKPALQQEINVSRCETKNNERKKWFTEQIENWRRTESGHLISIKKGRWV